MSLSSYRISCDGAAKPLGRGSGAAVPATGVQVVAGLAVPPGTATKGKSARRAPSGFVPGLVGVARVPSGWGRRWVGGRAIPLVAAASVSGGRGRGGVRRRSAPAGRWVYRPGCLPSLARAAGHAGRVSVEVSELSRPLNDQAAATYFFGFVSSPYGEQNSMSLLLPCCGLESQFSGPLDHQASARVGCLPFGVARPPGTPRMRSAPRGGTSPIAPAAHPACGRGRWAGNDRLAVDPPESAVPAAARVWCPPTAPAAHWSRGPHWPV